MSLLLFQIDWTAQRCEDDIGAGHDGMKLAPLILAHWCIQTLLAFHCIIYLIQTAAQLIQIIGRHIVRICCSLWQWLNLFCQLVFLCGRNMKKLVNSNWYGCWGRRHIGLTSSSSVWVCGDINSGLGWLFTRCCSAILRTSRSMLSTTPNRTILSIFCFSKNTWKKCQFEFYSWQKKKIKIASAHREGWFLHESL